MSHLIQKAAHALDWHSILGKRNFHPNGRKITKQELDRRSSLGEMGVMMLLVWGDGARLQNIAQHIN